MSGCERWGSELGAYLDGALDPEQVQQLESHFSDCASCRLAIEAQRSLTASLKALPQIPPSPQFEARFWARLARDQEARSKTRWGWVSLKLALGGAAVGAIALMLSLGNPALPDEDWEIVADAEQFEMLIEEDPELLLALEVLETWDGSEEG
jgi:anti-sigma factor RsiW